MTELAIGRFINPEEAAGKQFDCLLFPNRRLEAAPSLQADASTPAPTISFVLHLTEKTLLRRSIQDIVFRFC